MMEENKMDNDKISEKMKNLHVDDKNKDILNTAAVFKALNDLNELDSFMFPSFCESRKSDDYKFYLAQKKLTRVLDELNLKK
uniref:BESS domain-containing protein n=1 Tax=Parastrongyloides trichosuri TaxID=131310 RepID=A0A0N5A5N9_PARTI